MKIMKKILLTFFSIILLGSIIYIADNQYKNNAEEKRLEELQQNIVKNPENVDIAKEQPEETTEIVKNEEKDAEENGKEKQKEEQSVLPEYEQLYNENQDLIGWIKIEDTPIDYPVMQTFDDPTFYIHRDWNKNESTYGLPLIDGRCTLESENIIIYSHNMKNGKMFGSLKKYKERSFFDEHQIIEFDTIYEKAEYQIISVSLAQAFYDEVPNEDEFVYYDYIELDTKERFQEYIDQIKENSLYDTGITAEYGDSLITLCTCSYHVKDGRLLVVAKKIQ